MPLPSIPTTSRPPPGVESGFTKVERDVFPTRLLQCKGKRTVRCTEVACESASLNTGDVFILDMGLQIFQWNGASANRHEISKAFGITHSLHNDRGARGTIVLMAEDADNATFWGALGGQIEVTNAGEDDDAASAAADSETKLFHVDGDDGTIKVTEVPKNAEGRFTRDMLDSDDAFILDVGSKLYVWTGKTASKEERVRLGSPAQRAPAAARAQERESTVPNLTHPLNPFPPTARVDGDRAEVHQGQR
jgi:hypothetical protein